MNSIPDELSEQPKRNEIDFDQHVNLGSDSNQRFGITQNDVRKGFQKLGADGVTYPIAFLNVTFDSATGNAVGGMLVTDNTGIPLEFLITSAVRPTRAQQILYGNRLKTYIAINLCGNQLLNDIKTKPRVLFVNEEYMLAISAHTAVPVLMLQQTEQLGTQVPQPTIVPPRANPEYADIIDLSSLNADMVDAFNRIEKCREVLAARNDEYKV